MILYFAAGYCSRAEIFCRLLRFTPTPMHRCGDLLLAYASSLTRGKRAPATRKSLQTFAKKFLMHAHKSLRKNIDYILI